MHTWDIIVRVLLSLVCGALVGLERELTDHPAGLRTHILVSMGACLFTTLSLYAFPGFLGGDRVAAAVVTGIGFIGGGAILRSKEGIVKGITTAASLWSVAAIGMALGAGYFRVGFVVTGIILVVLEILHRLGELIVPHVKREAFSLCIAGEYREGMVRDLSEVLEDGGCSSTLVTLSRSDAGRRVSLTFVLKVPTKKDIDALTSGLFTVPGVSDVDWS